MAAARHPALIAFEALIDDSKARRKSILRPTVHPAAVYAAAFMDGAEFYRLLLQVAAGGDLDAAIALLARGRNPETPGSSRKTD